MNAREWALWVAERARDPQQALSDDIAAELLVEEATTLSRLGHRLDAARDALDRLRWENTVVKEAMGLRGVRAEVDRYWPMPPRLVPRG